ncbi:hypothetical protein [Candidatus Finniella inopinata]|uniref:Uncharacterized protein n=1 Tax=Candidatus Finniella inopinata TaxID=1696036 RepID=A0A4Q7DF01_9PROT|nr:hypothetical protein [Candidatus Finniella inopinata]RZI45263.1 hypothetical protein EQU50_07675 [Candidatus Finniella inopinata]
MTYQKKELKNVKIQTLYKINLRILLTFYAGTAQASSAASSSPGVLNVSEEAIYKKFLTGKLIYRPTPGNDDGMKVFSIADLSYPLGGTFDLSKFGDTWQHLNIATGYRTGKSEKNRSKVEMWIAPRFLIDQTRCSSTDPFIGIMGNWSTDIGLFWTWGGWPVHYDTMDSLTNKTFDQLGHKNLFEHWLDAAGYKSEAELEGCLCWISWKAAAALKCFTFKFE